MSAQGKGPGKIAGQWPRNAVKEALKHIPFDYLRHLMPSIQEIPLPVNVFLMAYSSTKWFNLNGRCLVRQEIESVVYQSYGTDGTESSTSGHLNAIHKQVNDPEHITTTILEGFPEITKRYLYRQAARLFKEVYKKKENDMVRQRYDFLKGL